MNKTQARISKRQPPEWLQVVQEAEDAAMNEHGRHAARSMILETQRAARQAAFASASVAEQTVLQRNVDRIGVFRGIGPTGSLEVLQALGNLLRDRLGSDDDKVRSLERYIARRVKKTTRHKEEMKEPQTQL